MARNQHIREGRALITSAMKEMGEGYDLAEYKRNPAGIIGPDARVIQYVRDTGADPDSFTEGWCNPFTQFILKQNGYEYSEDNHQSLIANTITRTDDPVPGDVCMFLDHISLVFGFHTAYDGTKMVDFIGGAQAGRVCIFSVPRNRIEYFARPIRASKDWQPMLHPFWQALEANMVTVKRPTPHFGYPEPFPLQ